MPGFGQNLIKSWHRFLQNNFNVFLQSSPNVNKHRTYRDIEIQQEFIKFDNNRKQQKLYLLEYQKKLKKQLIEQEISFYKQNMGIQTIVNSKPELAQEIEKQVKVKQATEFSNYSQFLAAIDKERQESIQQQQRVPASSEKILAMDKDEKLLKVSKLQDQLKKIEFELNEIEKTKKDLQSVNNKLQDLEPGYILVTGDDKLIVLGMLTYYQFQLRHLTGVTMNPETIKCIDILYHNVDHNLPVKREMLYEVLPELFEFEIEQLDEIEQEKILSKRPYFINTDKAIIRTTEREPHKTEDYLDRLKSQDYEMLDLLHKKTIQVATKWENMFNRMEREQMIDVDTIFLNIMIKDQSKRTQEEQQFYEDVQDVKEIQEDYKEFVRLNRIRAVKYNKKVKMPIFVEQNPVLREYWTQKWEEIVGNSFDFSESVILPRVENAESAFDKAMKEQRQYDIDELIKASQREYKEKIDSGEIMRGHDRVNKDEKYIKKLNVMATIMNMIPDKKEEEEEKEQLPMMKGPLGQLESPEEHFILLQEFPKVLFLNNKDPKKYTVEYWAKHFNIEPQKLRNVFNYVSYGVPQVTNNQETGRVFRFIYNAD